MKQRTQVRGNIFIFLKFRIFLGQLPSYFETGISQVIKITTLVSELPAGLKNWNEEQKPKEAKA